MNPVPKPEKKEKPRLGKRKCVTCKDYFQKTKPLQQACSIKCALEHARKLEEKKEAQEWRERKKELKESVKRKKDYANDLQVIINSIVREIDKGHPCISSGLPLGKNFDAGHFHSVGSNPQIRFHLMNIFAQTVYANNHQGGQPLEYYAGLGVVFGLEIQSYCFNLKGHPELCLTKEDLKSAIKKARECLKWVKDQNRSFTTKERITIREELNKKIGIYEK